MLYVKTALFGVLAPGTVVGLVPYLIISRGGEQMHESWGVGSWLGGLLAIGGSVALLWCARDFVVIGRGTPAPIDPPKQLVIRGLYRHVRNPMYVGVLSILMGEILLFPSLALAIYAAVVFCAFQSFVMFYEEPVLRKKFGESYIAYCREVNRWLPRWRS